MLTWILLILALIVLTVLFTWLFGQLFGRGEILPPLDEDEDVIQRNRESINVGDLESLSFDVVPRGYHPEQVEAALADLKAQLKGVGVQSHDLSISKSD
ncbi:DivIVA domain-containing protein [Corynebacterium sp. A21]|uniref:DivIVA domain-containing protein n=1 Tax=Corynebacterium sp. A21 TaxID=3457318 RepID=UPI003FD3A3BF